MQYIATVSGGESSQIKEIKDMVLATNPLLESFGCAKTLKNNNSSRHVRTGWDILSWLNKLLSLTWIASGFRYTTGKIFGDSVQRPRRAGWSSHHKLFARKGILRCIFGNFSFLLDIKVDSDLTIAFLGFRYRTVSWAKSTTREISIFSTNTARLLLQIIKVCNWTWRLLHRKPVFDYN